MTTVTSSSPPSVRKAVGNTEPELRKFIETTKSVNEAPESSARRKAKIRADSKNLLRVQQAMASEARRGVYGLQDTYTSPPQTLSPSKPRLHSHSKELKSGKKHKKRKIISKKRSNRKRTARKSKRRRRTRRR